MVKIFIFAFCTVGFLLTLSSHAIATDKYSERCGICLPSKTIKPANKGSMVYREYEDKPGEFVWHLVKRYPLSNFRFCDKTHLTSNQY